MEMCLKDKETIADAIVMDVLQGYRHGIYLTELAAICAGRNNAILGNVDNVRDTIARIRSAGKWIIDDDWICGRDGTPRRYIHAPVRRCLNG